MSNQKRPRRAGLIGEELKFDNLRVAPTMQFKPAQKTFEKNISIQKNTARFNKNMKHISIFWV